MGCNLSCLCKHMRRFATPMLSVSAMYHLTHRQELMLRVVPSAEQ